MEILSESAIELECLLFINFYTFQPLECSFIFIICLIWTNLKMLSDANKSVSAPFNLA